MLVSEYKTCISRVKDSDHLQTLVFYSMEGGSMVDTIIIFRVSGRYNYNESMLLAAGAIQKHSTEQL